MVRLDWCCIGKSPCRGFLSASEGFRESFEQHSVSSRCTGMEDKPPGCKLGRAQSSRAARSLPFFMALCSIAISREIKGKITLDQAGTFSSPH
jgi:hypothetical protein